MFRLATIHYAVCRPALKIFGRQIYINRAEAMKQGEDIWGPGAERERERETLEGIQKSGS